MNEIMRKSFIRCAIGTGGLLLLLTGCSEGGYENFEECQLKELQKLSKDGRDLSEGALRVIAGFCAKYPLQSEQSEKRKSDGKIRVPNWKVVGPEKGYSGGVRFLVDTNNIEADGSKKTFWYKALDKKQTVEGNNYNLFRVTMDCHGKTMDILSSEKTVNGTTGIDREGPWYSETVTPGTNWSDVYQYVCGKK